MGRSENPYVRSRCKGVRTWPRADPWENPVRFPFSQESPRSIPTEFPCDGTTGTRDGNQTTSTSKGRRVDFGDCGPLIQTSKRRGQRLRPLEDRTRLCPMLCPRRPTGGPTPPPARQHAREKCLPCCCLREGPGLGRRSSKPRVGGSNPSSRPIYLPSYEASHEGPPAAGAGARSEPSQRLAGSSALSC